MRSAVRARQGKKNAKPAEEAVVRARVDRCRGDGVAVAPERAAEKGCAHAGETRRRDSRDVRVALTPASTAQARPPARPRPKIGKAETAVLLVVPICIGLGLGYLMHRYKKWAFASDNFKRLLPIQSERGLAVGMAFVVVGRLGYFGLGLMKAKLKAVEARARADEAAAAPAAPAASKKDE